MKYHLTNAYASVVAIVTETGCKYFGMAMQYSLVPFVGPTILHVASLVCVVLSGMVNDGNAHARNMLWQFISCSVKVKIMGVFQTI